VDTLPEQSLRAERITRSMRDSRAEDACEERSDDSCVGPPPAPADDFEDVRLEPLTERHWFAHVLWCIWGSLVEVGKLPEDRMWT
jgi:hypothetical protein